jgi:hypothetical protein
MCTENEDNRLSEYGWRLEVACAVEFLRRQGGGAHLVQSAGVTRRGKSDDGQGKPLTLDDLIFSCTVHDLTPCLDSQHGTARRQNGSWNIWRSSW